MDNRYGVMMYGPQRWAAVKRANGQQLGWSWSDIGSGLKSIANWGVKTFTESQKASVYKDVATAATLQQQTMTKNIITAAALLAVGFVTVSLLKK